MRVAGAVGLDVCCVLVFVGIGRASHEEAGSFGGFVGTAWPFLVGLGLGWVVLRAWRRADGVGVGVGVWLVTVAGGMGLRALAGQGTAFAFVVVALCFLGLTLVGWRGVAALVRGRAS